ncbi:hypothetical protein [Pantoea agglomerans]|uniref:hypothetical protein n=1 Tax=Enterobacter agglomerans TaxID=549 RepID=UPI00187799B3|nr:hypothetical protein [Pantoea agglomerans]MBE5683069.1 hypothetical protein [Pantoea agglomerans]
MSVLDQQSKIDNYQWFVYFFAVGSVAASGSGSRLKDEKKAARGRLKRSARRTGMPDGESHRERKQKSL